MVSSKEKDLTIELINSYQKPNHFKAKLCFHFYLSTTINKNNKLISPESSQAEGKDKFRAHLAK